jgi:hypothetical protein
MVKDNFVRVKHIVWNAVIIEVPKIIPELKDIMAIGGVDPNV